MKNCYTVPLSALLRSTYSKPRSSLLLYFYTYFHQYGPSLYASAAVYEKTSSQLANLLPNWFTSWKNACLSIIKVLELLSKRMNGSVLYNVKTLACWLTIIKPLFLLLQLPMKYFSYISRPILKWQWLDRFSYALHSVKDTSLNNIGA